VGLSVLASGYCVLGAIMTAWISATPGQHDLQALEVRAYLWLASAVIFLGIAGTLTHFALRAKLVNITGILIVILGFIVPFLGPGGPSPIFFFWVGFLLLLRPNEYFRPIKEWIDWARIGLLAHVVVNLLYVLFNNLINEIVISSYFVATSYSVIAWVANPISSFIEYLFPSPRIDMPGGGFLFMTYPFKGAVTSLLGVLAYMVIGAIIGNQSGHILKLPKLMKEARFFGLYTLIGAVSYWPSVCQNSARRISHAFIFS